MMQPHRPSSASSSQAAGGRRYQQTATTHAPSSSSASSSISHYQIVARLSDREDLLAALHHHDKKKKSNRSTTTTEAANHDPLFPSSSSSSSSDLEVALVNLRSQAPEEINQFTLLSATNAETLHCRDLHNPAVPAGMGKEQVVNFSSTVVTPVRKGNTSIIDNNDHHDDPASRSSDVAVVEYRFLPEDNESVKAWVAAKECIEESTMNAAELLEKKNRLKKQKQQRKSLIPSEMGPGADLRAAEVIPLLRSNSEFVSSLAHYVSEVAAIEQLASETAPPKRGDNDKGDETTEEEDEPLLYPIKELLVHPPTSKVFFVRPWPKRTLHQFLRELAHDPHLSEREKVQTREELCKAAIRMVARYHSILGFSLGRLDPDHLQVTVLSRERSSSGEDGSDDNNQRRIRLLLTPVTLSHTNRIDDLEQIDFSCFIDPPSSDLGGGERAAPLFAAELPPRPSQLNRFDAGYSEATARAERRRFDWTEDLVARFPKGMCPSEAFDREELGYHTTTFIAIDSWQLGRLCAYIIGALTLDEFNDGHTIHGKMGSSRRTSSTPFPSDQMLETAIMELTKQDPFERATPTSAARKLGLISEENTLSRSIDGADISNRIDRHIDWLSKQIVKVLLSGGTTFVSLSTKFMDNSLALNTADQSKVIEAATKELFRMECQSHFSRGVTPVSEGDTYKPSPRRVGSAERRLEAVERPSPSPFTPSRSLGGGGGGLTPIDNGGSKPPRPFSAHTSTTTRGTYASSNTSSLVALQHHGGRNRPTSAAIGRPPLNGASPITEVDTLPYLSVTIQNIQCLKIPLPNMKGTMTEGHSRRNRTAMTDQYTSENDPLLDTRISLIPACISLLKQSNFLRVDVSLFRPLPPQGQNRSSEGAEVVVLRNEEDEEENGDDFSIQSTLKSKPSCLGVTVSVLSGSSSIMDDDDQGDYEDNGRLSSSSSSGCSSTARLNLRADVSQVPSFEPDGKVSLMVSVPPPIPEETTDKDGSDQHNAIRLRLKRV